VQPKVSLRSRQGDLARQSILDAAAEVLEHEDPDAVSLAQVADTAGVAARTLYRYFPTRNALMAAALEHLNETLGLTPRIDPDDIVGTFLGSGARLAGYPTLVHNLRHTEAGREARSAHRAGRAQELADAVATQAPAEMDPQSLLAAGAVVASLCGSTAWMTLCDEANLSVSDAQAATGWAIETILEAVRRGEGPKIEQNRKDRHA
jgi:AcrR family transcriptional regulator